MVSRETVITTTSGEKIWVRNDSDGRTFLRVGVSGAYVELDWMALKDLKKHLS